MKKISIILFVILSILHAGCSVSQTNESENKTEITVSAAASLRDAMLDIKESFESDHPTIQINYNFGASGALEQQIKQGAPVDLFFSASEEKFDGLVKDGLIKKEDQKDILGNEMVLVVSKQGEENVKLVTDLPQVDKLSIGIPETVPAGYYAKEALVNEGIWTKIEDKIVYAKDVRQVLTYIETGNVDAGIVYKTDALLSKKVKITVALDEKLYPTIKYPLGIIKDSKHQKEATVFFEYMQQGKAEKVFKKYGFKLH